MYENMCLGGLICLETKHHKLHPNKIYLVSKMQELNYLSWRLRPTTWGKKK